MLKEINAYDLLKNLYEIYSEFYSDPNRRFLAILGRPRIGKRYILQKFFSDRKIDYMYFGPTGGDDKLIASDYYEKIYANPDGVFLDYEMTATGFTRKYQKQLLFDLSNVGSGVKVSNPYLKNKLPEHLTFRGKFFVLDDPYSKKNKMIINQLDGYIFNDPTLKELTQYIEDNISEIASVHGIKEDSLHEIINIYRYFVKTGKMKDSDVGMGVGFSVYGVASAAKILETQGVDHISPFIAMHVK